MSIEGSFEGLRVLRRCQNLDTEKQNHYAPVAVFHEIEDITAACDENDLHTRVIKRCPAEEQVKVTGPEYTNVEGLSFE